MKHAYCVQSAAAIVAQGNTDNDSDAECNVDKSIVPDLNVDIILLRCYLMTAVLPSGLLLISQPLIVLMLISQMLS